MPTLEVELYRIIQKINVTEPTYVLVDMVNGEEHECSTYEQMLELLKEINDGNAP